MKKLEGKIMILIRHLDDVVPHLVHTRLKSRKESFDTLARKLNEIYIFTAIGLKKPCLDGIGSFMKALKARPYLVSNFKDHKLDQIHFEKDLKARCPWPCCWHHGEIEQQ